MHFDELAQASLDPRTPADERWDINAEIYDGRTGVLGGQKLPHPDEVLGAVKELDRWSSTFMPMAKAVQLQAGLPFIPIGKTSRGAHEATLYLNDLGVVGGLGKHSQYIERPGTGFEFLRHIVQHIDILKAIILTFQRQVSAFCIPESDPSPLGYNFVRVDGEKMTDRDLPRLRKLQSFIENCGDETDPRKRKALRREDMRGYVMKLLMDSLSLDHCPVETQLASNKKLSGIYNVPGESVRLCTEEGYEGDDEIYAVQVVQGIPISAFTYADMAIDIRNPRTDLNAMGYGYAEPEMMIRALTGYYNAISFNHAGMDKNSLPRGIVTVFGAFSEKAQDDFRRKFNAMMKGASNRHGVPIMFTDPEEAGGKGAAVAWTPMDKFDEMLFARWIVLQASLAGALYGKDPSEFHFDSFAVRNSSPLNSNDIADKIAHSKSKGLEPLVRFVQNHYNQWIVPLVDPDYRLEFLGLQAEDYDKKHERLKLSSTVDEIRDIDGRDPHPDPKMGGAPVNPNLSGIYMMGLQGQGQPGGGLDSRAPDDEAPLSFGADGEAPTKKAAPADDPELDAKPMTKAEVGERRGGLVILERDAK